jgi:hypothetical protein
MTQHLQLQQCLILCAEFIAVTTAAAATFDKSYASGCTLLPCAEHCNRHRLFAAARMCSAAHAMRSAASPILYAGEIQAFRSDIGTCNHFCLLGANIFQRSRAAPIPVALTRMVIASTAAPV